jgi:cyclopropane fatty-acyl-phospholipid synthase-like methyltransferase
MTGTNAAQHDNPDRSTVALFQDAWRIYRKMVDNDYLFHAEAYGTLHRFLAVKVTEPFAFLDLACGDASASAEALAGTAVASYHGIDFSKEALTLAAENLAALRVPVTLECRDFVEAVSAGVAPFDIAWIGLSLHHLQQADKGAFLRRMRSVTDPDGALLVYENASPDGESRPQWLERWDAQQPAWTAYTEAEWNAVGAHVHAADFPETDSTWRRLGRDAGYGRVEELYRSPTDLFRLYCFMP